MTQPLKVPELALVVLIGASGSGKSTFARKHFKSTEILSSDMCRGIVSDDENNQAATGDAFDLLHFIAKKRLARGLLTVVDATNVQPESRKPLVALAREFHALPVAIVLDVPEKVCRERNKDRPTAHSAPTSCVSKCSSCGHRCADSIARASVMSSSSIRSRRSRPQLSSASRYGTTGGPITDRSMSLATCTAASTSSRCC